MKRGFTLIEILVVVAIIGLLIAVIIPSLSNARDMAKCTKCLANMRDMATGVNTFAAGHRNRFQLVTGAMGNPDPYGPDGPNADLGRSLYEYESGVGSAQGVQGPALLCWPAVLLRQSGVRSIKANADWGLEADAPTAFARKSALRRFELMSCPSDRLAVGTPWWPLTPAKKGSLRWFGYLSYGINEDVMGDITDTAHPVWRLGAVGGSAQGGDRLLGRLDAVQRPGEVLMLADMGPDQVPATSSDAVAQSVVSKEAKGPLLEFAAARWEPPARLPFKRHRGGSVNVTFADGHGGFAKKLASRLYGAGTYLPGFAYVPKTRVSPYDSGQFPAP